MSKTSRFRNQNGLIPMPKHLLIYKKDASPYSANKEFKTISTSRLILNSKSRIRPPLKRGKTLTGNNYDENDIACLISVERNYIQELVNSPVKYRSKSPIFVKKSENISPLKAFQGTTKFNSLTGSDFLGPHCNRKLIIKRNKSSITPDPFIKNK